MKNFLLTCLAVVALASCSAPKYAYYFDHHDNLAGKRKKQTQTQVNADTRVTMEEIRQAIEALPQSEEPVVLASAGAQVYPSTAKVKTLDNTAPIALSGKAKHDLKVQMKSAIKDYKKQSHAAEKTAGSDKNQLAALLLAIFLGGLGIHRFYIGRTGTALLQLGLLILGLILVVPLIALGIWVLIDIIRIAMGKLVPKNGSYNPKL